MIEVLIVDDDALTLELHAAYVSRLDGFHVAGECAGARAAITALTEQRPSRPVDLVLLDITMPDGSGIDVMRRLRAAGDPVDVIAVTSVRDVDAVRQMSTLGVQQYLVKPFTFTVFRERMQQYRQQHERVSRIAGPASQGEIDALLHTAASRAIDLPKGLSAESLNRVTAMLRAHDGVSAVETGAALGMSRVTARRYLEHLTEQGLVARVPRYGTPGRPETEYRWRTDG